MSEHEIHPESYYVKIWGLLLVLLVISICGPMLEIQVLTLITAFGIAFVKAAIVAAYFMHLNIEKKYVHYMLYSMLIFIFLFFAGTAPDVMRNAGQNWENISSISLIKEKAKEVESTDHHNH